MDYRIEQKEAFKAVVVSRRFEIPDIERKIPGFWREFFEKGLDKKLIPCYGLGTPYDSETGTIAFGIGCPPDMVKKMQDDFETWDIPSSKYIAFRINREKVVDEIEKVWKHINTKGIPIDGYEYSKVGFEIEDYAENGDIELWVPVEEKQ